MNTADNATVTCTRLSKQTLALAGEVPKDRANVAHLDTEEMRRDNREFGGVEIFRDLGAHHVCPTRWCRQS